MIDRFFAFVARKAPGTEARQRQFRYYQPQLYERLREKAQGKQDLLEALAQD